MGVRFSLFARRERDTMENKEIEINYLFEGRQFEVVPMTLQRDWMDETYQKFAYKCLPLNIANQYGWQVLSPTDFTVEWHGDNSVDGVKVSIDSRNSVNKNFKFVSSHFGNGIATINVDFLVKTPKNISLYVTGVANNPIDGIQALDAIVETDWLPFTFTYNFKFTKHCKIKFHKGEPLFSFFPIQRDWAENFKLVATNIESNPELNEDYLQYSNSREEFNANPRSGFQRFYHNESAPHKKYSVENHTKRLFFGTIEEK